MEHSFKQSLTKCTIFRLVLFHCQDVTFQNSAECREEDTHSVFCEEARKGVAGMNKSWLSASFNSSTACWVSSANNKEVENVSLSLFY